MSNDIEREAFERWAKSYDMRPLEDYEIDDEGYYEEGDVQRLWSAWQAARAQAEPSSGVPDGWKLVPEEPTEEMTNAAMEVLLHRGDIYENQYGEIVVETITPRHLLKAMLTAAPTAPTGQGGGAVPDMTSSIVNDCCWTFVEAMPHNLPGPIFNDLKPALYEALKQYHGSMLAAAPKPETQP